MRVFLINDVSFSLFGVHWLLLRKIIMDLIIKYVISFIYLINLLILFSYSMDIGDWGLGIGDWGLGPIPNPQSPIPNIC